MDWGTIIGGLVGIGGGLVGGWFTAAQAAKQWERERKADRDDKRAAHDERDRARAEDAAFAALDLADCLEKYALACAQVISDNEQVDSPYDYDGGIRTNVPKLPPYPEAVSWRSVGVRTTNDVRQFRSEVELAILSLEAGSAVVDPPDLMHEATNSASALGLKAWNLAARLRAAHSLPETETIGLAWDYKSTLARIAKRREANAAASGENP